MELIWAHGLRDDVRRHLLSHSPSEAAGALLCRVDGDSQQARFLVLAFESCLQNEMVEQEAYSLVVDPTFWVRLAKPARKAGLSILPIHTHPGTESVPRFSRRDLQGELALQPVLERLTGRPAAAVVMGEQHERIGMFLSSGDRAEGESRAVGQGPHGYPTSRVDESLFSRHIAAFGLEGQSRLQGLTVGVVGVSGTGSHVCQQLLRLGVGRLIAIDPDVVERVNLNRVVLASQADVAKRARKVDLVAPYAESTGSITEVQAIAGDVLRPEVHAELYHADAIFGCTDTVSSRAVLNRIAVQRFIPYWDCGTEIASGGDLRAYGRLRVVLVGGPCLYCMGVIDPVVLRAELLPEAQRNEEITRGYIRGSAVAAPAVVSVNGVVASLAVSSFLRWAVGRTSIDSGEWIYRSYAGDVRRQEHIRNQDCAVCAIGARMGRADSEVRL